MLVGGVLVDINICNFVYVSEVNDVNIISKHWYCR